MVKQPLFLMAALLLPFQSATQNPRPLGGEFQVNTYTTGDQNFPEIAADLMGNFVVVWHSAQDGDGIGIFGQRYDVFGDLVGGEFQINTYTTGDQIRPMAAYLPDGFVVVWQSDGSSGSDNSDTSIQGQFYDAMGIADGDEFQINSVTTGYQSIPQVASDLAGNFVVVWQEDPSPFIDGDIRGQRFHLQDPDGDEFVIGTGVESTVAMADAGNSVVIWQRGAFGARDLFARRYDSMGDPLGGEFMVNTYTTEDQVLAQVGMDAAGNFVVVWQDRIKNNPWSIQAQRYDFMGNTVGGEFQVDTTTTDFQNYPAAAIDADGNFLVVWRSHVSPGTDTGIAVLGQQFDSAGTKIGGEFQVNTYTTNHQLEPEIVTDGFGNFLVVWKSIGSSGTDNDDYSVQGQRYYSTHIFTDGFESGGLLAWSFIVP